MDLKTTFPGINDKDIKCYEFTDTLDEPYRLGKDSMENEGIPKGEVLKREFSNSGIYPGTSREYCLYIPAQYNAQKPACLMVFLDGDSYLKANTHYVFDNLIHKRQIPVMIGLFVAAGDKGPGLPIYGGNGNRSLEFDSIDERYSNFLLHELIAEVKKEYAVTDDPEGHGICGISSSGNAAFAAAWHKPDYFRKVISHCGSFANIRGGHNFPSMIRQTEKKPLRVFLQTGEHDLNTIFGNWRIANEDMASALQYKGYEYQLVVGVGGHSLKHGVSILPDTMRWIWRDYP